MPKGSGSTSSPIHCREHVAGYKVPRQLLLVDEIPLTAAGKPDAAAAKALF